MDALLRQMETQAGIEAAAVDTVVLTGNTTMLYLLTGRDVDCLSHAPFSQTSCSAGTRSRRS